jgi:signal transduction histidine kinase
MGRMISDLLDFARGRSADGIPIVREALDVDDLCAEIVDELRLSHPERQIESTVTGPTSGEWDRDRLAQAIANVLANAILYGAAGTAVRLRIAGDDTSVTLSVNNQGEIIEPLEIPKLFDPYLRGRHGRASPHARGLGLGLFITKQIVVAHGGTIRATSAKEEGTTFTIVLPRHEEASGDR